MLSGIKERRFHPRYRLNIAVTLKVEIDHQVVDIHTTSENISLGGMLINCDQDGVKTLTSTPYPHSCNLCFSLGKDQYQITSRVVINRRLSHNDYQISFKFVEFNPVEFSALEQHLTSLKLNP